MKKSIALLTLVAASALAIAALKKKAKPAEKPVSVPLKPKADFKPALPELPLESVLSGSLLESYRVQCQVMMDGYPEGMHIEIIHHLEFKDSNEVMTCAEALRKDGYNVEEKLETLNLVVSLTIPTSSQAAFDEVVKVASFTRLHDGLYQGWILDNCH